MEFIEYYHKHGHKIRLVNKKKSPLMIIINLALKLAGLFTKVNIQDFMTGYVTTIGRSIYASPKWTLDRKESSLVVHELCHVSQWGFRYAMSYIFSKKKRMLAESTCVQAEMMCFPEKYENVDRLHKRASHFVAYGVSYTEALDQLIERREEVHTNNPQPGAKHVAVLWYDWKIKD